MRIRGEQDNAHIWPGFVDALSTVLLVFIFILVGFISAQMYLSDTILSKNSTLDSMRKKIAHMARMLDSEISGNTKLKENAKCLQMEVARLEKALNITKTQLSTAECSKKDLTDKICALNIRINELGKKLDIVESDNQKKEAEIKKLTQFSGYQSKFFELLQNIVKDKNGIMISGDRFIFQSELFFDSASATLSQDGLQQIKKLAEVIKEIGKKIPSDIEWILRVDGHTDNRPISNDQFKSNWELSAARAIAVVKALIACNIQEKHLAAAGFGEYHPLTSTGGDISKNRRIEFKLDMK